MKTPVRSTRVRLPGRIAREDVDAGDARRARAREGPSQSHPLRQITNPPPGGFFYLLDGVLSEATAAQRRGFNYRAGIK